jgi:FAD/FMN-containing dehydrogenase
MNGKKNYQATTKNFQWLIQHAIDNNISLRAMGAGWSFTEVAMADGIVDTLELRNLFRIEDSFVDPHMAGSRQQFVQPDLYAMRP